MTAKECVDERAGEREQRSVRGRSSERAEERVRGQARVLLSESNDQSGDQSGRVTTSQSAAQREQRPECLTA